MSTHYVLKIQYVNKPPETRNIGARVTTLGREAGDIVLGDPQSSGRHAEIHFENGNVRVKDLGSTNGTFYNGQRSPEFALQAGQGFSIGQTVMTLMAVHDAAAQRAGQGKTMIAMGGLPPRPPGPPGAPPGRPPGAPPPGPAGFGAPPGAPPQGGFGAPPSGPPMGGPPQGGFGGPPPSSPPMGGPPQGGFGGPPPSSPPMGAPMGGPPQGGFGGPPQGGPPQGGPPQGGFGGPPPGGPPQGGFGGPPPGGPPPGGPPQGGFGGPPPGSPPPGGGFGGPPPGSPPPGGGFGGPPASQPGPMAAAGAAGGAFAAAASSAPQYGGGGPSPMAATSGGEARGDFSGTGGELLGQLLVGYLLTLVTFGIYMPWFMCKFANFIAERTSYGPTAKGTVRFRFEGQGGDLFVTFLVGYLLTMVTFGIYMPWFMCKLSKFYSDNTVATTDDGSSYKPDFQGQGGDLFVTFLVGYLLTAVTFGIYGPWFICKLNKWFAENTKITKNGQMVGGLDFTGQGGDLLVTFIVGYLLTIVTFGIYMPWFQVKMLSFNADNTKIDVEGTRLGMRFTGQGGELFVIILVGYLLSIVTLGIYMFWMMAKLLKWQLSNTVVFVEGGAQMSMGAPMGGQVQQLGGAPGGPQPQPGMYGQPPQGQLGGPGAPGGYGQPPQGGGGYGGPPPSGPYA